MTRTYSSNCELFENVGARWIFDGCNYKLTLKNWFVVPQEKACYVQRKQLHNRHSCSAWTLGYRRHSVSIGLSCSNFSFYDYFARQFAYAVFYIQNRKMCLSKKILCQYFVGFSLCLGQLLCYSVNSPFWV